jgi:hypothetical protein
VLIVVSPVIVIIGGLQAYISLTVNDEAIRNKVSVFFNEKIGKAVKFDTIFVRFDGSVFLSNFSMSKTLDFNDNLNLLKCRELKIKLSFLGMLRGRITVDGIAADSAAIAFSKQSGEDYSQFFNSILYGSNGKNIVFLKDHTDFSIRITNSTLSYYETFVNDTMNVSVDDFNADCGVSDRTVTFELGGRILRKNDDRKNGSFSISGKIRDNGSFSSGAFSVSGSNIDLCYLNYYMQDISLSSYALSGYCNASGDYIFTGNSISGTTEIKVSDAEMRDKNPDSKLPVAMKTSFILRSSGDILFGTKYRLRSCEFYDGDISLKSSGVYNSETGLVSGNYTLDECDLGSISTDYLSLFPFSLSGYASSSGNFSGNLASGTADENDLSLLASKLVLTGRESFSWAGKNEFNGTFSLKDSFADSEIKGKISGSDYRIKSESFLRKIIPLSTDTGVAMSAENVSAEWIVQVIRRNVGSLLDASVSDKSSGFDEVKFLTTPAGIFLNGNDFLIDSDISKIGVGGKAVVGPMKGNYTLKKGILKGKFESVQCYGGTFSHDVDANFNTDFPRFSMNASLQDFDLAKWRGDSGEQGIESGTVSVSYSYNMNGSRASHIIDNGISDFKISMKNAHIGKTPFQKKIASYCAQRGYPAFPEEFSNGNLSLDYHQTGENGGFQQFNFQSDVLRLDAYIRNKSGEGLNGQGSFTVTKKDSPTVNIPYRLSGPLFNPSLLIDVKGKKSEDLKLF